jgi:ketosteroid isomerase-like protein
LKNRGTGGSQKRFQRVQKQLLDHNWTMILDVLSARQRPLRSCSLATSLPSDPSLPATVCQQRWVSIQDVLFDARRVTTIAFSEGRAAHNSWRSVTMNDLTTREPAIDPQDLERLLVARENAGDVTGMTALFEADAVVDIGGGTFLRGKEAIHEFFTKLQVTGFGPERRKFQLGEQRPALICGDLALTSTRSRDGTVTSEVARRQKDGTWLWVIDRYSVAW